jgi:hypothetical protein
MRRSMVVLLSTVVLLANWNDNYDSVSRRGASTRFDGFTLLTHNKGACNYIPVDRSCRLPSQVTQPSAAALFQSGLVA